MKIFNQKSAFTLAEVLITMAVIGVVASMTIPSLMKNYQDTANYAKWKKEYSVANQAIKTLEAQNGYVDVSSNDALRNNFETILPFIQKAAWRDLYTESKPVTYYKGTDTFNSSACYHPVGITKDGSLWSFRATDPTCATPIGGLAGVCGFIRIDVNGINQPNMFGKDIFTLWLTKNNGNFYVYPAGSHDDDYLCIAGSGWEGTSNGCSAMALLRSPADMP